MLSDIIIGSNLPEDLRGVLEKYGIDMNRTLCFVLRCDGPSEPLLITSTMYAEKQNGEGLRTETRTFNLVEVAS